MKSKQQDRREWIIFSLLLFLGIFLLQFVASIASVVPERWSVVANVESNLNPDQKYSIRILSEFEPVEAEIMTPPAWDLRALLTPVVNEENSVIVPMMVFRLTGTPIITQTTLTSPSQRNTDLVSVGQSNSGNTLINQATQTAVPGSIPGPQTQTPTAAPAVVSAIPTSTNPPPPSATPTIENLPTPTATITSLPTQSSVNRNPPNNGNKPTREPKPTKDSRPTKNK